MSKENQLKKKKKNQPVHVALAVSLHVRSKALPRPGFTAISHTWK